ncbi:MAG TPA: metal-dependent transcriptional regulator [Solirubrobacterales bacterium]|nr:metal-dependent transcriptional regulator [Solirubrobacterales bacterium]
MTSGQHHAVRRDPDALATEAIEDYAKAIYALQRRQGGPIGTSALAERLGLSPASVTAMLKRMHEMKLVAYEPYHGVTLTPAGERVALEVMRHHRLLESYLAEALGMSWDRVHDEAEVLEHYISEELEERIAEALGNPSRDPHGDPIPDQKLALDAEVGVPLGELGVGEGGTFSRVSDSDPEMLRYLGERGIQPGARVEVVEAQPFGGPLLVKVDGREHALGGELAAKMRVEVGEAEAP